MPFNSIEWHEFACVSSLPISGWRSVGHVNCVHHRRIEQLNQGWPSYQQHSSAATRCFVGCNSNPQVPFNSSQCLTIHSLTFNAPYSFIRFLLTKPTHSVSKQHPKVAFDRLSWWDKSSRQLVTVLFCKDSLAIQLSKSINLNFRRPELRPGFLSRYCVSTSFSTRLMSPSPLWAPNLDVSNKPPWRF